MQSILKFIVGFLLRLIDHTAPKGKYFYEGLARHMVSVAFETVLLREHEGQQQVFLTLRSPNQSHAGSWTLPGSILRPSDAWPAGPARRVIEGELGCELGDVSRIEMDPILWREERGMILSIPHLVTVHGELPTAVGQWFLVDDLPEDTLDIHREFIRNAMGSS